jgi:hypothetical protein
MSLKGKWTQTAMLIMGTALHLTLASAAEVTVSIEPVSCAAGNRAVAWITLANATGVTGADITMRLPNFVIPGPVVTTEQSAGFLVASRARAGQIDIAIASSMGFSVDQGPILGVPFTLEPGAEPGLHPLTFDRLQLYDSTPAPALSQAIPGSLSVPPPPADLDADGLPDLWEIEFFGSTAVTGDADSDRDGITDAGEFIVGTDPTRADSVFAIEQAVIDDHQDAVALRWTALENRTYQIEWSDDPLGSDMTWRHVYRPDIAVDITGAQWIDDGSRTYRLPSASAQRYYRLRASRP